jgi:hypothetical protein
MRLLLLGVALAMGAVGWAEEIAVFAKNEIVVGVTQASGAIPDDADKRAFLERFRASVRAMTPFEATLPLVNPAEWGKTISATTRGEVRYHKEFARGFVCRLSLENLLPDHRYILTLNGNPQKRGNALLPEVVPGIPDERYYDFLFIQTDARGRYDSTLGIHLQPSAYDVRIYVKDADDFKIVLYRDFFDFTVK